MKLVGIKRGAILSPNGKYRYLLIRRWNTLTKNKGVLSWVMLNPSIADENIDDPTIRRVMYFSYRFGFSGADIYNIFAYRSTSPTVLSKLRDPIGSENEIYLTRLAKTVDSRVVFAWGINGTLLNRSREVMNLFMSYRPYWRNTFHLGMTNNGQPKHPLYIKKRQKLIEFGD